MNTQAKKKGVFGKLLNGIEVFGNRLPDPFMLFAVLAVVVILLSFILSLFGISVIHPGSGEVVPIKNLASGEGLEYILTSMLRNFTDLLH